MMEPKLKEVRNPGLVVDDLSGPNGCFLLLYYSVQQKMLRDNGSISLKSIVIWEKNLKTVYDNLWHSSFL